MSRRLLQLSIGLALYGLSVGLMVRSNLGVTPWDVFHQGLSERSGLGIGTISNVFLIGVWTDVSLWVIPPVQSPPLAWAMLLGGILLNGVAGGAYIGAGLGPGPRDGLMTGLVRRTGKSIRLIRTAIEVVVVAVGWTLGGTLGVGTLLYALTIGPIVHRMLPLLTVSDSPHEPDQAATDCCPQPR